MVVCEGTLDALAIAAQAARSGLSSKYAPVAESGLAVSDMQWETILAIHDRPPVLCADGDGAGQKASAEWAAAGKVTKTEVPKDFPTADKVSVRP